jgi:hypothetical protein
MYTNNRNKPQLFLDRNVSQKLPNCRPFSGLFCRPFKGGRKNGPRCSVGSPKTIGGTKIRVIVGSHSRTFAIHQQQKVFKFLKIIIFRK